MVHRGTLEILPRIAGVDLDPWCLCEHDPHLLADHDCWIYGSSVGGLCFACALLWATAWDAAAGDPVMNLGPPAQP